MSGSLYGARIEWAGRDTNEACPLRWVWSTPWHQRGRAKTQGRRGCRSLKHWLGADGLWAPRPDEKQPCVHALSTINLQPHLRELLGYSMWTAVFFKCWSSQVCNLGNTGEDICYIDLLTMIIVTSIFLQMNKWTKRLSSKDKAQMCSKHLINLQLH